MGLAPLVMVVMVVMLQTHLKGIAILVRQQLQLRHVIKDSWQALTNCREGKVGERALDVKKGQRKNRVPRRVEIHITGNIYVEAMEQASIRDCDNRHDPDNRDCF
jgi:hypothetical protein